MNIAFLGLGTMGFPMAGHLAAAGHEMVVYNRTQSVAEQWVAKHKGWQAKTPAEAVQFCEVALTCLGNDQDVREVYQGKQGIFSTIPAQATLIDHTTTSASLAQNLATQAATQSVTFLDAPVSGGQVGAEQGLLTIMVGGDESVLKKYSHLLSNYATMIKHIGASGAGQRCKMVNQLCVAGVLQGLAEGLSLAKKAGIKSDVVLDALQQGAGSSWQMVNRTHTMMAGEFDFGFAVDWMRKDLDICMNEAAKLGLDLPLAELVDKQYRQLQGRGYSRCDTSVLIKQFDNDRYKK